jgi:hypothetical protein
MGHQQEENVTPVVEHRNKHVSNSDPAGVDPLEMLIQSHHPSSCTAIGTSWGNSMQPLTELEMIPPNNQQKCQQLMMTLELFLSCSNDAFAWGPNVASNLGQVTKLFWLWRLDSCILYVLVNVFLLFS